MIKIILLMAVLASAFCPGTNLYFTGDSETDGRASDQSTRNPATAFKNIYLEHDSIQLNVFGVSGDSLIGSIERFIAGNYSLVHFQESGFNCRDGQRTPQEYLQTAKRFIDSIRVKAPKAIISTETAFTFPNSDPNCRSWSEYNQIVKDSLDILLVDIVPSMTRLISILGQSVVLMPDLSHYQGVGNLLIAVKMAETFGISYNFDRITLPQNEVQAVVSAISGIDPPIDTIPEPPQDTTPQPEPTTYETIYFQASGDGIEENLTTGNLVSGSSDFEFGEDGGTPQLVGLRFLNVDIVTALTIQFECHAKGNSSGPASLEIFVSSDYPPFTESVSNRLWGPNTISWQPEPWESGERYMSPNILPLIDSSSFVIGVTGSGTRRSYSSASYRKNGCWLKVGR